MLNYWLHKLDESGLKDSMWQEWSKQRIEEFTTPDAQHLGFDTVAHPFLLLVGGIVIAFLSLTCEKIKMAINACTIPDVGDKYPIHKDKQQKNPNGEHFFTPMCIRCQKRYDEKLDTTVRINH